MNQAKRISQMRHAKSDSHQNDEASKAHIHTFIEDSTETPQYVVVEPSGVHCVIIDPVLEHADQDAEISTTAADELLQFVTQRHLKVEAILNTSYNSKSVHTAAWYLRMQLLPYQGYAPRVCGSQATAPFGRLFSRKYGTSLRSTLENEVVDTKGLDVGSMHISIISLPGHSSPGARAYLVEDTVFGAQPVEIGQKPKAVKIDPFHEWDSGERHHRRWRSMQNLLSLPGRTPNSLSTGDPTTNQKVTSNKPWLCWKTSRSPGQTAPS